MSTTEKQELPKQYHHAGPEQRWYRFSFRGLAEKNFVVANEDLDMKVEFYSGDKYLDCVTRKLYALVERDRAALAVNGYGRVNGGAVWKTYDIEFKLPFPEIDRLKLIAFERGVTISKLIGEIDRGYRLDPPIPGKHRVRSLSSAVRIFVLEHMEASAGGDAIKRALAIAAKMQIRGDKNHPSS